MGTKHLFEKIVYRGMQDPETEKSLEAGEYFIHQGHAARKVNFWYFDGFISFSNQGIRFYHYPIVFTLLSYVGRRIFGKFLRPKLIISLSWQEIASLKKGSYGVLRKAKNILDICTTSGTQYSFMIWRFKELQDALGNSDIPIARTFTESSL